MLDLIEEVHLGEYYCVETGYCRDVYAKVYQFNDGYLAEAITYTSIKATETDTGIYTLEVFVKATKAIAELEKELEFAGYITRDHAIDLGIIK